MQMSSLRLQFAHLFHDLPLAHNLPSIRLELFISQACSEDVFKFFPDKLMIPIILPQSVWMYSVWLVFTSNLNSQTTWPKFKS